MKWIKGIMIFLGIIVSVLSVSRYVGGINQAWYTIVTYLLIAVALSLLLIVFQRERKRNRLLLIGWILPIWFVVDAIYEMTQL
ncbi:hypothetical protein [Alkalicoccobacillus murimartini]|uniref:Uncharacterized protein n=1 Tax=Alkalicoccobacillus murimartini TaxID=171685 RepID=A0ABT9YKY3_9BACI|nr:hypothetical protein [Alkalicoccobacillus murimartini]MDQ0208406.1 hypothetical protein [Alkalicoccobacillus murimartini]